MLAILVTGAGLMAGLGAGLAAAAPVGVPYGGAGGRTIAWGRNDSGQASVPAGLSGVIAIAAGGFHNLALKSDLLHRRRSHHREGGPSLTTAGILLPSLLRPAATLTRPDTGAAISGQTISFTSGSTSICTATTNTKGVAQCASAFLISLKLTATSAGGPNCTPSSDTAGMLGT